jgi:hypothetical protein
MQNHQPAERPNRAWAYLLLAIPFIAMLWVPSYSSASPQFAGIPFFYWYQFAWVIISGLITAFVYLVTSDTGWRAGARMTGERGQARHD